MSSDAEAQRAVDAWRGNCLNIFARGERAVGASLESLASDKIRHLAGQRLADLLDLSERMKATSKQKVALGTAIDAWQKVEKRRQFLAHGAASVSYTDNGDWTVLFDLTAYRNNKAIPDRWSLKQKEAEAFHRELHAAFKGLSSQLGQLRKRATP